MPTLRYQIAARRKPMPVAIAAPEDFELAAPSDFDPSHLTRPGFWSLYAIDPVGERALFVEMPAGTDLGDTPFAYAAQFDGAQSVVSVPLDQFVALSDGVSSPATLAMIYSTGRCGSTLASRILAQLPEVWSISEPDSLTNLVFARYTIAADRMGRLLSAARRFICLQAPETARNIVIKPRSEMAFLMEAFSQANPGTRNLFMYRDATSYANSIFGMVQRALGNNTFLTDPAARQLGWYFASGQAPASEAIPYLRQGQSELNNLDAIVLGWALRINAARAAVTRGIAVTPLHYDDLNADRPRYTALLLAGCGIDPAGTEVGLRGFERDSQEGSAIVNNFQAIPLDDDQRAQIQQSLRRWGQVAYATERLEFGGQVLGNPGIQPSF